MISTKVESGFARFARSTTIKMSQALMTERPSLLSLLLQRALASAEILWILLNTFATDCSNAQRQQWHKFGSNQLSRHMPTLFEKSNFCPKIHF